MSKKYILILTLIFISKSFQQKCEGKGKDECLNYPSSDLYGDFCCWYSNLTETSTSSSEDGICKKIPYSASIRLDSDNTLNYDVINGVLYKVDCGNKKYDDQSVGVLNKCGEDLTSFSLKKCKKYSSYVDSCCYYSGKKKDQKYNEPYPKTEEGCYWLGAKYSGNINWAGLKLSCEGKYLKRKFLMFLMLFFI
jgi:hypothetical protein